MLEEILKENEGRDIEISFISETSYTAMSYIIKEYRLSQQDKITIYDKNNRLTFKDEDLKVVHIEDDIIYVRAENIRMNFIIKKISSLNTLARGASC